MDGEYHADFTVLFLICHQSRLEIQPNPIVDNKGAGKRAAKAAKPKRSASKVSEKPTKYALDLDDDDVEESELSDDEEAAEFEEPTRLGPENCWLEAWTKLAGEQGTRAKERLRDGVQLAIQTFGAGFYTCPSNAALHQRLRSGELSTQDYYRQLLRLVYRLLMLMVAEDKRTESGQNLLHPIDTPAHIRDRYNQFYSVGRIRKMANDRRGTPHRDLYDSLKITFLKLRDGYAPLGIPGIGSFLFSDTATPDLDSAQITNEALLDAFRNLCFTEDSTGRGGSVRRAVDFGNLGSEELGSIYESLLELHPEIDSQDGPFALRTAAGNERKTSGSYYTPTSLINCLLDSALDPVVNQAIDVPDREEAKRRLLDLKVCDPACGSGHFLIAAANRMALHLARLETQDTEPTTLQIQHAKRQIIGRCIYGVDINEMAVELCKVSLWMEALEPGKPFSFLESHIKCGNSLLGATPRLLNVGIPDEAFNTIEGDDKEICAQLKKQNKRERIDHKSGQRSLFEPFYKLGNMAERFAKLSSADDDSLDAITGKQKLYEELVKGTPYLNARFWADTWCASFVWKKNDTDIGRLCPTELKFREIERNPHSASLMIREEVKRLADQYQFHHWHLVFPDVFVLPDYAETSENEQAGWNRGFDVVLGNPPWEKIKLQDAEWFSTRNPEIANATNSTQRKKLLNALASTDPAVWNEYLQAVRFADSANHLIRMSQVYEFNAQGDINTFALFAEQMRMIKSSIGAVGCVVPTAVATDNTTREFFEDLVSTGELVSLYDFSNDEALFPEVRRHQHFCLLTLSRSIKRSHSAQFAFFLKNPTELSSSNRIFELSAEEIQLINPNTRTAPLFKNSRDAAVAKHFYRRVPILMTDGGAEQTRNSWRVRFATLFHMTNDSSLFRPISDQANGGVLALFDPKMAQQYNHRAASLAASGHQFRKISKSETNIEQLRDPHFSPAPLYCVEKTEVDSRLVGWDYGWLIGFKDVTGITSTAIGVFTVIPRSGVSNKFPLLLSDSAPRNLLALLANLNSFTTEFVLRLKFNGLSLNFFYVKQIPLLPPETYQAYCDWHSNDELQVWIVLRVLELVYTAWDLESLALDAFYDGPPFRWDEGRRFQIRCELDSAYLHLYLGSKSEWGMANGKDKSEGVNDTLLEMFTTPRDAVCYIMDTFPIVRRKDEAKYREYRTKRVILEIYDQMTEIIEANEAIRAANPGKSEEELRPLLRSYQSPLNPPPGPPTDANGNFIPYANWTDEIHRQYAGVIHPPRAETARNSD